MLMANSSITSPPTPFLQGEGVRIFTIRLKGLSCSLFPTMEGGWGVRSQVSLLLKRVILNFDSAIFIAPT